MKKFLFALALFSASITAAEVTCETFQDSIKKIRCNYMALAQDQPRNVTFYWTSPDNPSDNRSRIHIIAAGHVSVFDFRYYSGRSEGKWKIEVFEGSDKKSVSTIYDKSSHTEIIRSRSEDPLLNN